MCICILNAVNIQLHDFSDASLLAYGVCLYMRSENKLDDTMCHLICAKSRKTPIKFVTLPRLELCATLSLGELATMVVKFLNMNIDNITVAEIQRLYEVKKWRYAGSAEELFKHSIWWVGTEFLHRHSVAWSQSRKIFILNPNETPEYKIPNQIACVGLVQTDIFSRYSSFIE